MWVSLTSRKPTRGAFFTSPFHRNNQRHGKGPWKICGCIQLLWSDGLSRTWPNLQRYNYYWTLVFECVSIECCGANTKEISFFSWPAILARTNESNIPNLEFGHCKTWKLRVAFSQSECNQVRHLAENVPREIWSVSKGSNAKWLSKSLGSLD